LVTGNSWLKQQVPEALRAMERLGVSDKVGVYAGENVPSRDCSLLAQDVAAGGGSRSGLTGGTGAVGHVWQGACGTSEPVRDSDIVAPADGFPASNALRRESASDFIISAVRRNPGEVTILAIGPVTNIAKAIQTAPDIVPLVKEIVFQAGNFEEPVINTFNAWFDAAAARKVIRSGIPVTLIGRDVTNTVKLDQSNYQKIANAAQQTDITKLFKANYGRAFDADPRHTTFVWDTLALAYAVDRSFSIDTRVQYVDFVTEPGPMSGRSVAYDVSPSGVALQKVKWVRRFDTSKFFKMYTDLLTRPTPVTLSR
jgi:inosine-uridine nucleoside N-ribohydrolase